MRRVPNTEKIQKLTGWHPKIDLDTTVERVTKYLMESNLWNRGGYRWQILNNLIYTTGSKLGFRQVGCNIGGKGPNGAQISRIIGPFMSFLFGCNWELKAMIFFSVILRMGAAFPLSKFRRCRHTRRILSKCVSTQDNQYLKVGPCRSQNCVRSPEAIHLGSNFQTRCLSER